ncbi:hypothetical protein [Chryseobacterium taihuense]|uniref:Outer membrane protein beta-barrel domain-containing protein n=1 Tax=Chryseobacterium taihuense TaxID=1141221 RepID=A0ABY0R3J5_9FLAO|nr:hypothetical protein [Chryseobacterium taihuense]SDM36770.1 hypothetical protein SAMN05216273_1278 [Chryseobacterium taihuense]
MKTKLLLLTLFWGGIVLGQEFGNFKERHRIHLLGFSKESFKFSPKDSIIVNAKNNVLFNKNRDTISYNEIQKKIGKKEYELDNNILNSLGLEANCWTQASIEVRDDKVFIYPFTYNTKKDANIFFKENNVYLSLEKGQSYSFKYRTRQLGVVTIPLKWYMNSKLGNVTTDINAMISGGWKFGKTHIVKLPHEKKVRQYQRTFSFNLLAGMSKLTFDESNTVKKDSIKGSIAAISTGVSFGVHYQDFTFLIASGFDFPTSNRRSWQFNNIPWLGLGFGYNFIKLTRKTN